MWSRVPVASATARAWFLVTNGSIFYLVVNQARTDWATAVPSVWRHPRRIRARTPSPHCSSTSTSTTGTLRLLHDWAQRHHAALQAGQFMAKSYVQTGGPSRSAKHPIFKSRWRVIGQKWRCLSGGDGGLYAAPKYIRRPRSGVLRGVLPGLEPAIKPHCNCSTSGFQGRLVRKNIQSQ